MWKVVQFPWNALNSVWIGAFQTAACMQAEPCRTMPAVLEVWIFFWQGKKWPNGPQRTEAPVCSVACKVQVKRGKKSKQWDKSRPTCMQIRHSICRCAGTSCLQKVRGYTLVSGKSTHATNTPTLRALCPHSINRGQACVFCLSTWRLISSEGWTLA